MKRIFPRGSLLSERREATVSRQRRWCRVASDSFLSSLFERIMNSGVRRSLGSRAPPDVLSFVCSSLFFLPSPSSVLNDLKIECHPIFALSFVSLCAILRQEFSVEFNVVHLYENLLTMPRYLPRRVSLQAFFVSIKSQVLHTLIII